MSFYQKKWEEKNSDKLKKSRKKSYDKHRQKRIDLSKRLNQTKEVKEYRKKYSQKSIKILSDEYIKKVLIGKRNLNCKDISPELIEAKRALLMIKRLIKKQKDISINDNIN